MIFNVRFIILLIIIIIMAALVGGMAGSPEPAQDGLYSPILKELVQLFKAFTENSFSLQSVVHIISIVKLCLYAIKWILNLTKLVGILDNDAKAIPAGLNDIAANLYRLHEDMDLQQKHHSVRQRLGEETSAKEAAQRRAAAEEARANEAEASENRARVRANQEKARADAAEARAVEVEAKAKQAKEEFLRKNRILIRSGSPLQRQSGLASRIPLSTSRLRMNKRLAN